MAAEKWRECQDCGDEFDSAAFKHRAVGFVGQCRTCGLVIDNPATDRVVAFEEPTRGGTKEACVVTPVHPSTLTGSVKWYIGALRNGRKK